MSKARELSKLPNYVLSTVAELKLAVGKEQGDKAFVGGYYTDGDGGGGDFYWDAVSVEVDNSGTIFQVTGTTTGRWKRIYSGSVSVKWFGAKGDWNGTSGSNDTTEIQNAINHCSVFGGIVFVPIGQYFITATILLKTGVSLIGEGYWNSTSLTREGVSSFYCHHNGAAMLSLKGAIGCTVSNISLEGSQTGKPKTGLLLGRATSASAGYHTIKKVSICGWFQTAAIYSIASEDNYWEDILTWNFGGDALYGMVTSTQDIFAIDSLFESTNLNNTLVGMKIITTSPLSSSAGILMVCAEAMGSWTFSGCYLTQYAGTYIRISNGEIDGVGAFGPITFTGVSGEPLSGGNPIVGIDLTAPTTVTARGISIIGSRFQLSAGADHYDIRQSTNVTLLSPNIIMQAPEAFPYATSEIFYNKISGGILSVGRQHEWINATLYEGWTNSFGSPYAPAGYNIDATGRVSLRGTVDGGTGTIFVLPVGYIPKNNLFFPVFTNGQVLGRILVTTAGLVSHQLGNLTNIDLSTIQFKP